jgi:hypothetical protein
VCLNQSHAWKQVTRIVSPLPPSLSIPTFSLTYVSHTSDLPLSLSMAAAAHPLSYASFLPACGCGGPFSLGPFKPSNTNSIYPYPWLRWAVPGTAGHLHRRRGSRRRSPKGLPSRKASWGASLAPSSGSSSASSTMCGVRGGDLVLLDGDGVMCGGGRHGSTHGC